MSVTCCYVEASWTRAPRSQSPAQGEERRGEEKRGEERRGEERRGEEADAGAQGADHRGPAPVQSFFFTPDSNNPPETEQQCSCIRGWGGEPFLS